MIDSTHKKLLARTPRPDNRESWLGYLLRLSELNGYDRPTRILTYAGLDFQHLLKMDPPLEQLSAVLGFKLNNYFSHMEFGKHFSFGNNVHISHNNLNLNHPKVCIQCVEENGVLNRFWDLKFAIACPTHKVKLMTYCAACTKKIVWNRKGLITCGCGQEISENQSILPSSIVSIMNLLMWKLFNDERSFIRIQEEGFPVEELRSLEIDELLIILNKLLIRPSLHLKESKLKEPIFRSIEALFHILHDWPNSYWNYLEFHAREPENYVNFTTQFHTFYQAFCRSGQLVKPIEFLHTSLIAFGDQKWKKSTIAKKSAKRAGLKRTIFGINALVERLGVTKPTVLKWIDNKTINATKFKDGVRVRYIIDEQEIPFLPSKGEWLNRRDASKLLKLPERFFILLVEKNVYKRQRLAFGLRGYAILDLQEFRTNLIEGNSDGEIIKIDPEWIPLQTLLSKKAINLEVIVDVLQLATERKILFLGGKEIPEIRFDRQDLINNFGFEWLCPKRDIVNKNLELF